MKRIDGNITRVHLSRCKVVTYRSFFARYQEKRKISLFLAYNIIRLSQFRFHIIRQRFDARVEDSHREKEEACKPARNREIAEGLR